MNISSNGNPYREYVATFKAEQDTLDITTDDNSTFEAIEDFACGMLGLDSSADDAQDAAGADDGEGLFYNIGQCAKAAGSVASMISFFV